MIIWEELQGLKNVQVAARVRLGWKKFRVFSWALCGQKYCEDEGHVEKGIGEKTENGDDLWR